MSQIMHDLYAMARLRAEFFWYCTIRKRPDLFTQCLEREFRDLFPLN